MRFTIRHFAVSSLVATALLAGCSSVDDLLGDGEQVDYKSTVTGQPLSLPPDMTQTEITPKYDNTKAGASYNAYAKAQAKAQKQNASQGVLPQVPGIQVKRSGDTRWLEVTADANIVYPKLIAFWTNEGFTINRDDPSSGYIETDWAENRAKIPGDFLNRMLGSIISAVEDSGERERFRTRIERVNGKTEVYLSHERMVETQMDRDGSSFKWLPAKEDPGLNAIMLTRMMTFMGIDKEQAAQAVKTANKSATVAASPQRAVSIQGPKMLVSDSVNNTYSRIGSAITAANFVVNKTDAANHSYVVLYLDTDNGEKREASNVITRLWGDKGNITPLPYTVVVSNNGQGGSVVTVLNPQGEVDNTSTATRILTVLQQKM